jgi:tetratricopeptide (TPR) repeat protein
MARSCLADSLQIAQHAHDDFHTAGALCGLAHANYYTGDLEGAMTCGKAAVELARAVGDPVLLGECLVAFAAVVDDPLACRAIYEEALTVTRRSGDRIHTAWSHNNLGNSLLSEGDLDAARHHFEQARVILREVGTPTPLPDLNLGWVHLRRGDVRAADAAFTEALHKSELLHNRREAGWSVLALACSAAAAQQWERAACLIGFSDAELDDCGAIWAEPEQTYRAQSFADIQNHLGIDFDRYYDSGRVGDRHDLIGFALGQQQPL